MGFANPRPTVRATPLRPRAAGASSCRCGSPARRRRTSTLAMPLMPSLRRRGVAEVDHAARPGTPAVVDAHHHLAAVLRVAHHGVAGSGMVSCAAVIDACRRPSPVSSAAAVKGRPYQEAMPVSVTAHLRERLVELAPLISWAGWVRLRNGRTRGTASGGGGAARLAAPARARCGRRRGFGRRGVAGADVGQGSGRLGRRRLLQPASQAGGEQPGGAGGPACRRGDVHAGR